jgi:tape measure domain-containing protein
MSEKVEYVISLRDSNFSSNIDNANNKANGLEQTISRLTTGVALYAGAMKALDFGKDIVDVGAKFDSYEIGLATLLKSEKQAHQVFEQIKADAKNTPLETEGLVIANRALISAGVSASAARMDVLNLANAIVATGGGDDELKRMAVNMQQVKNIGHATALDIKQFAFAGINIYGALADATGKPISEVKEMTVTYDLLSYALEKAGKSGGLYANALEKGMNSTTGQISNLSESIVFLKDDLYEAFKPSIQSGIASMADFVNSGKGMIEIIKKMDFSPISNAFRDMIKLGGDVVDVLHSTGKAFGLVNEEGTGFQLIINGIGHVMSGMMWVPKLFWKMILGIGDAFKYVDASFVGAWAMIKEFATNISGVFQGIGDVIMGALVPNPERIKKGLIAIKDGLASAGDNLGLAFSSAYDKRLRDYDTRRVSGKKEALPGMDLGGDELSNEGSVFDTGDSTSKSKKSKASGISGPKSITINITNLIGQLSFNTSNLGASTERIKEEVTKVLLSVVNDSNRVAGI